MSDRDLDMSDTDAPKPRGPAPPSYDENLENYNQASASTSPQTSAGYIETNLDEVEVPSEEEKNELMAKYLPAPLAPAEDTDEELAARPARQWTTQDSREGSGGEAHEMVSFMDDAAPRDGTDPTAIDIVLTDDAGTDWGSQASMEADESPRSIDQQDTMQVRRIENVENGVYNVQSRRRREYDWECPINIPVVTFLVNNCVRGLQQGKDAWPDMSTTKKLIICLIVLFVIGGLLLVTLLPASFVYIEYHEYGLIRNKWTGTVDYSEVHEFGCHLMAPQDEVLRLPSTAHHVFRNIEVLTDSGLMIEIQIYVQYALNKQEIPILLKDYYTNYQSVMESLIISSVKNLAVEFSLDEFRLERKMVEGAFKNRTKSVLQKHHMIFQEFQLGRVTITKDVMERYMKRILLQIDAEREYFLQSRALELKQTEKEVKDIQNRAREVKEKATAEALVVRAKAEAEADAKVQKSYQKAMTDMFSRLNVTQEEHKLSYMYVKTLDGLRESNRLFSYGYESNTAFSP